ncbi:hypothetical protein [Sphingobacterium sp. MYb382]|uniref:hypothetical protein n=1 Tax=Sphingobacterium sp. MYb382 TaxID=2745278 RepID=UPI0030A88762
MTMISKETAIQEKLSALFDELLSKKENIRVQLMETRNTYQQICEKHILSGYRLEGEWLEVSDFHQNKFVEYDMHCYLIDILSDYRNIEGFFPEYQDMMDTLDMLMLRFAGEERYELAAIIKAWLVRFNETVEKS